jgi:sugar phosphate isomerase/epimerase
MHCGRVDLPDRTRDLIDLCNRGLKDSLEFRELKSRAVRERDGLYKKFFERTLKSLDELNRYTKDKGISLGVETRFYYGEIPSFEEIGIILNTFKGSNIFYWHDTGHAGIAEYIGLSRQKDFLDSYGSRLIGIHLHDVLNGQDHMAPSNGELDFDQFRPYLENDTLKVIEAHHPATVKDLMKSREFLGRVFHGII